MDGEIVLADDHTLVLKYCTQQLLPIWERWTDGNQTMRRALEAAALGPEHHKDQLNSLTDAAFLLFRSASQPHAAAPLYSAIAVIYALQDYPLHVVIEAGLQAITMNATAEEELEYRLDRANGCS
ncbi:MAG: hypothetical protein JWO42_617 [Chloroflexi bacterium]|jgi:hypothetical protein|nr:hypothetical protein [Chloroflexota bacterium]